MFFTGTRKHVHRAGGQSPQKGSGREGGIIHDGARSGTRERGSEYGEAARSCTSGRGTGDAGPAGMMRGYAHPPFLKEKRVKMDVRYYPYRKQKQWVVYWKSAWTGKRHHRGFSSEENAREFVDAMTEIEEREKEALRRRRKRATCPRLTVEELLSRYLSVALSNPVTIRETRHHAAHFLRLFRDRQAARLTCDDALRFIEAQRARGLRQTTINRRVSILRAALRWGVRMGLLAQDPLAGLRLPKASSRRVPPPTPRELRRIFRVAAPHLQRVIVIGAYCGPRIGPSELFRLRWRDVDLERGVIRMPNAAKGSRDAVREIPVRKALAPLLRRWRGEDEAAGVEHVVHWRGRQVRTPGADCSQSMACRAAQGGRSPGTLPVFPQTCLRDIFRRERRAAQEPVRPHGAQGRDHDSQSVPARAGASGSQDCGNDARCSEAGNSAAIPRRRANRAASSRHGASALSLAVSLGAVRIRSSTKT